MFSLFHRPRHRLMKIAVYCQLLINRGISSHWRLSPKLRIYEAALLMAGYEPQKNLMYFLYKEDNSLWPGDGWAAVTAIIEAIEYQELKGHLQYRYDEEDSAVPTGIIPLNSTVDIADLKRWLRSKGVERGYFLESEEKIGFRDPNHPRYSAKLAAAVEAWEAYDETSDESGSPKQRMEKWLRVNAHRFSGLIDVNGKVKETPIQDIAKIANWNVKGGRMSEVNEET